MSNCQLCGEPMPEGEEMFKYHGYSGNCPKPPLPRPSIDAVVEYLHHDDGAHFWLGIRVNREQKTELIGQFASAAERQRAQDDMLNMMRSLGAKALPVLEQ